MESVSLEIYRYLGEALGVKAITYNLLGGIIQQGRSHDIPIL